MVSPMPVLLLSVLIKVVQVSDLKYLPTGSRQTSAQNPALAPYFTMTYKDLIYSSFFSVPLASLCHSTYTFAQAVSHTEICDFHILYLEIGSLSCTGSYIRI